MNFQKRGNIEIGQKIGMLRDQCNGIFCRLLAFLLYRPAIQKDLPSGRCILVCKQFDIIYQGCLSAPGRPHNADDITHLQHDLINQLFLAVFPNTANDPDFIHFHTNSFSFENPAYLLFPEGNESPLITNIYWYNT